MRALLWTRIDKDNTSGLHYPKRPGDVGFDLEASEDLTIPPGEHRDVPTNIRVKLPDDCWGEMRARSSIAKRGLQVAATIIDNGYTGPLFLLIYNANRHEDHVRETDWLGSITIKKGQRIGQLVLHHGVVSMPHEVDDIPDDPRRGSAGFGSTGL